jgi:hypothetical protein
MILKLKWYELLKIVFKQQKTIKGAYIVKLISMTFRYQSHDVMLFIDIAIGQSRQQHFAEF